MRPGALLAVSIVVGLGALAASVEYGQYTSLMRHTATADVEQLCMSLREAHHCPAELSFPKREAKDPWGQTYHCRTTLRGAIVYTLGAEGALGGTSREADIACATFPAEPSQEVHARCFCSAEASATQWLQANDVTSDSGR